MPKRKFDYQSIADVMKQALQENNLQKGMDGIAVKDAWLEVMGQGVMAYTNEIELKKDMLIVRLSSSALREELSYGKEKIIKMLNEKLDKSLIKTLKLV